MKNYGLPIKNNPEYYILERPIETDIGILYPVKVAEAPEFYNKAWVLMFDKYDLDKWLDEIAKSAQQIAPMVEVFKSMTLIEALMTFGSVELEGTIFSEMHNHFKEVFELCFKEDVFHKIQNEDEYTEYIKLICDVNNMKYEKPNPNPNIRKRDEITKALRAMKGDSVSFESMLTSVELATGKEVADMTLYKFHKLFERVSQFKRYEATVLYGMFGDTPSEPWFKDLKEEKKKESFLTNTDLERAREGIVKDI